MTPVTQTHFVGDPDGVLGNCLQAAVASYLDKPLDAVPHFVLFQDWLKAVHMYLSTEKRSWQVYKDDPGVECIAMGMSPRGVRHAVVWDGEVLHDPHPSRAGFVGHPDEYWVLPPIDNDE